MELAASIDFKWLRTELAADRMAVTSTFGQVQRA